MSNEPTKSHWYNKVDPSASDSPASPTADPAPATTIHIPTGAIQPNVAYLAYGQMEDGLKRLHTFALCYRPSNNNITFITYTREPDKLHHVLNMDAGLKIDRLFVSVAGADLLFSATAHQLITQPPGVPGVARLAGVWAPTSGPSAGLQWPTPTPNHATFSDVPVGSTFWEETEVGAILGIVSGPGGGKLGARDALDKGHALAMIVRAAHAVYTLLAGGDTHANTTAGKK